MQCPNRCNISSFFEIRRCKSHFKWWLVQSKPKFFLFWLKFDFNYVSRAISFLEISSIFIRSVSQFSSWVVGISIFNIRKGSLNIWDFRMLNDSNLEIITFIYFDFPVVNPMFLHNKISIIVFVHTHWGLDCNSTVAIIFEL